jgi:uncharacterized protein
MSTSTYALITGASSGIGECFARALAERKRNLVLVARSADRLEALAAELRERHGILAEPLPADLSGPGAPANLAARLVEKGLAIDLLINNAGFGARGEFATLPLERQVRMLDLNVLALVELTHCLLPAMIERRAGGVVNVASTASFQPVPYTAVYAASKAFVVSFSMALAEELRPYNVRVVTLCPGGTQTNFFQASGYGRPDMLGSLQTPEAVVAAGLRALDRNSGLAVPRLINKAMVFVQRFVPRSLPVKAAARMFKP